jgi:hypothetical protein
MAESSIYFDEFPSELNLQQLEDFRCPAGMCENPGTLVNASHSW